MKTILLKTGEEMMVDDEDFESLSKMKWYRKVSCSGAIYAVANIARVNGVGGRVYAHRKIMGAAKGQEVDHKRGNGLDNQRDNLRIVTPKGNSRAFKRKRVGATSKYRGVHWDIWAEKWRARIEYTDDHGVGHVERLGNYDREEDAALAYNSAAIRLGFYVECLNRVAA